MHVRKRDATNDQIKCFVIEGQCFTAAFDEMNRRSELFSQCERRVIEIKTNCGYALAEIASDQRLPRAAADVENTPVPLFDDGHNASRIIRSDCNREFQPVVI